MSHLDTHTPTPRSRGISVTSSFTDSDFQSALMESQRGITELKDIMAKKLTDDKADNPGLGFCDFLKVEMVQLTRDSHDEIQQEMFNLLMRLKQSDKVPRYHNGMDTSTAMYSQALNQYPMLHTQMEAPLQQIPQTFTQVPQGHPQQQHLQHSQKHFQQTFTQPHAPVQQQQQQQQPMQQQQHHPQTIQGSEQQHTQQVSQLTAQQQS